MAKIIYGAGLACFFLSFFFPATPAQVSNPNYDRVKVWASPLETHFNLALEPLGSAIDYFSNDIKTYGGPDGLAQENFKLDQSRKLWRFFYSLPASVGWFSIWISLAASVYLRKGGKSAYIYRYFKWAGTVLLGTALLISLDFYQVATLWKGHFFLGLGAYFIVSAYALLGVSFRLFSLTMPGQSQIGA